MEIYLQEIMHIVAQALMVPVMIVLVFLILFALYSVGAIVMEYLTERRHFKANMPADIKAIEESGYAELSDVIEDTGLLRPQKEALQTVVANMGLPEDDLFALARSQVSAVDARYRRIVSRTELVTKIAPMMGLMCTLIPLGPGIVAMGQGDVATLSNSLLVAFDGTVAGLVGGVVSMVVSSIRKRWYSGYLVAMETLTTALLEKAEQARKEGVELPCEGDIRAKLEAIAAGAARARKEGKGPRKAAKEEARGASEERAVRAEAPAPEPASAPELQAAVAQAASEQIEAAQIETAQAAPVQTTPERVPVAVQVVPETQPARAQQVPEPKPAEPAALFDPDAPAVPLESISFEPPFDPLGGRK